MPKSARTHYHACNSGRGCASAGVDLDLATRGAYEDGKGDGRVEGRREAAEEVERLQLLLDQAEQYARDLQDGSAPGLAPAPWDDHANLAAVICATRDDAVHQLLDEDFVCRDCEQIATEIQQYLVREASDVH